MELKRPACMHHYLLPEDTMDSINAQQAEKNHEDLQGRSVVKRIKATVKKTETCFFCTAVSTGGSGATRPMSVQEVDDAGELWFLSACDSHTNQKSPSTRWCGCSFRAPSTPGS